MSVFFKTTIVFCLFLCLSCTEELQIDPVVQQVEAFGSTIQISIYDTSATPGTINRGLKKFQNYIERIDYLTDADSGYLSHLNRSGKNRVVLNDTLAVVIQKGIKWGEKSNGVFDITIKPVIDLYHFNDEFRIPEERELLLALKNVGYQALKMDRNSLYRNNRTLYLNDIRKGFALYKAGGILKGSGISDFLISADGVIQFNWHHPNIPATIYVRHPRKDGKFYGRLFIRKSVGIATAADYQTMVKQDGQYYHRLISTKSGEPIRSTVSISVVATNAMIADFYATYLFLIGTKKAQLIVIDTQALEAIIIWNGPTGLTHWISPGLEDDFELIEND